MDLRSAHKGSEKSSGHLPLSLTRSLDPRFQSSGTCIYRRLAHHKKKKKTSRETFEEEWDRRYEEEDDDDDEGVMEEEEEEDTRPEGTKTGSNTLKSKYASWPKGRHRQDHSVFCQPYRKNCPNIS